MQVGLRRVMLRMRHRSSNLEGIPEQISEGRIREVQISNDGAEGIDS